jgi:hypothetical protein
MFFDPMYFVFVGPAILLSLWASWRTKSAFAKYSKVRTASGLTGAQAAQRLLDGAGIHDVEIVAHRGTLTDHYNPATKKLMLSEPVYGSNSVAAVGVACHEAGHAIQHANAYKALWLRTALVPTVGIGSKLGMGSILVGFLMQSQPLILVGAVLFSTVLLFQVVTLPVEFDASARAKKLAFQYGIVLDQERVGVNRVLNAAALTYVAAAISTLLTLLYYLMRAGVFGGRR